MEHSHHGVRGRNFPPERTFHKHQKVKAWLAKHKRFQMHFAPSSSSWLNMVERFFADLTNGCIRDGSFQSVPELIDAIQEAPQPYKWKAKGEDILRKITRARESLASVIAS